MAQGRRVGRPGLQGHAVGWVVCCRHGAHEIDHLEFAPAPFKVFEDLQPMDAEEEISVWKGSRAKSFDQLDELVAVGWNAFEKGVG